MWWSLATPGFPPPFTQSPSGRELPFQNGSKKAAGMKSHCIALSHAPRREPVTVAREGADGSDLGPRAGKHI